jgi:hypothetical protein
MTQFITMARNDVDPEKLQEAYSFISAFAAACIPLRD